MNSFKNQCVIVTGAATGIGEACAILLASFGANVIVMDFNQAGAEQVVKSITKNGGQAQASITDLTSWENTKEAIDTIAKNSATGIQAIIHSAGGFPNYVNLLDCDVNAWDMVINSNLRSMFYLLKAGAPHMMKNHYGRFVSLSSMAARSGTNLSLIHI